MIISASRRTDIPAFYSEWFMNRIREGYFTRVNPFNPRQKKEISLLPEDVGAIVFWSKDPAPLLDELDELDDRGYRYCFQYTITGYPRIFEPALPPLQVRLETFKRLAKRLGPKRVIWRYDPVIVSSITDPDYHRNHFERLSEEMAGWTVRVVVSFLDIYRKTACRLKELEEKEGIRIQDIHHRPDQIREISLLLKEIAERKGLEIVSCSEGERIPDAIISPGSCIDAALLAETFAIELDVEKDPHQRDECLCADAEDMGRYDTCRHFCIYCYATGTKKAVERKTSLYSSESSALCGDRQSSG